METRCDADAPVSPGRIVVVLVWSTLPSGDRMTMVREQVCSGLRGKDSSSGSMVESSYRTWSVDLSVGPALVECGACAVRASCIIRQRGTMHRDRAEGDGVVVGSLSRNSTGGGDGPVKGVSEVRTRRTAAPRTTHAAIPIMNTGRAFITDHPETWVRSKKYFG